MMSYELSIDVWWVAAKLLNAIKLSLGVQTFRFGSV